MVFSVKCLTDNYAHIIHDPEGRVTIVVDPSEYGPVADFLKLNNWNLDYILVTHHHWDHVGGVPELKKQFNAKVVANSKDTHRIADVDIKVSDGEQVSLGPLSALVYEIPGHTVGHISYYLASEKALFSGDTLFSMGCGRLFEGTPQQMFKSLQKLATLPDDTQVYCGHEYTLAHCRFIESLFPDERPLIVDFDAHRERYEKTNCTVPSLLGNEKRFNPFLRASTVEAFTDFRARKDSWS